MNLRQPHFLTLLLFSITVSLTVEAQPAAETDQTLVDRLANEMAVAEQMQELPDDILAQFEQNPMQLPANENERMLKLFRESYNKGLLLDDFKSALKQQMANQYEGEISDWLNDENTQTVIGARQDFYTLQGKRKRVVTMYELDRDPPSEERQELISTLAETGSTAESSIESSVTILRSVIKGLSELSTQRNFSDAQIDAIANNFRSQIQSQISQQIAEQLLVTYHSVDSNLLEDYINFWQTDTGQWLDKAIAVSIKAAYEKAGNRFLQAIDTN